MKGIAKKIMKRMSAHSSGKWVGTPKDFVDLGSREAVDQALSRLVKSGHLRRVGHGLYDRPRFSSLLNRPAPADIDVAVVALARRDGVRIMPDGLLSANQLGITNAVPAKASYITDGPSRVLEIDGRTIRFQTCEPASNEMGRSTIGSRGPGVAMAWSRRSRGQTGINNPESQSPRGR